MNYKIWGGEGSDFFWTQDDDEENEEKGDNFQRPITPRHFLPFFLVWLGFGQR